MNANDEAIQKVRVASANGDITYLLDSLSDPGVRTWAAGYLAEREAVEAIPALTRLLKASDPKARSAGARALGRLRASEAIPELIALAEDDPHQGPQSHAIGALGRIGDVRAVPVLFRLLDSPDWLMRSSAAWALGLFADESALPVLRSAARRERFLLRGEYRKAIRKIRHRAR